MHERGMARRLVTAALAKAGGTPPQSVTVLLTPLAGTSAGALRMAWDAEAAGTLLADARLVVEERPAETRCDRCGAAHRPDSPHDVLCGSCGAPLTAVVRTDPLVLAVGTDRPSGNE